MSQYFSDRRAPGTPPRPFDAEEVDDLGVEIGLEDSGRITLVGHSYGGGRQTLTDLHCDGEVVVGSGASVGNQTKGATFVISLGQLVGPG